MFAKLLKHEWQANVRLLSLLCGCAVGLGCIAAVILRIITSNWDAIIENDTAALFLIPAFFFLLAVFLGIILLSPCIQYILLYRFYKSRFTDEGYLMFTLPVKTSHLFLSSTVHFAIWYAIYFVTLIISLGIAIGLGPVWQSEVLEIFKMGYSEMSTGFNEILGPGYILSGIFSLLVMGCYSIVAPMSAVVLGASIAKKHKVLTIIGILIGLSMVTSTVTGIITSLTQFLSLTIDDILALATVTPLLTCIVPLVFTIGGYFLSIHIMQHRLNLP